MSAQAPKLVGLQNLRAVAALMVVFYHILETLNNDGGWIIPRMPVGAAGVDIFFVLSGLIMVLIAGKDETPGQFFLKRLFRIVPLYWTVTSISILIAIVAPYTDRNLDLSPGSLINSFLLLPTARLDGANTPIVLVGWTLVLEVAFYALFALSLNFQRAWRLPILCGLIVLGMAAARALAGDAPWRLYGNPIVLEFAAGCLLGAALRSGKLAGLVRKDRRLVYFWLPIALSVVGFIVANQQDVSDVQRVFFYGAPAFILVAAVALRDMHDAPMRRSFLTTLGDASYSIYLIHFIVITLSFAFCYRLFENNPLRDPLIFVLALGGTIVGALISYRLIERPSNDLLRKAVPRARPSAAVP
jgi:exopolysaccharide production protein ExoZ